MSELRDMAEGLGCAAPARWSPPATWRSSVAGHPGARPGEQAGAGLRGAIRPAHRHHCGLRRALAAAHCRQPVQGGRLHAGLDALSRAHRLGGGLARDPRRGGGWSWSRRGCAAPAPAWSRPTAPASRTAGGSRPPAAGRSLRRRGREPAPPASRWMLCAGGRAPRSARQPGNRSGSLPSRPGCARRSRPGCRPSPPRGRRRSGGRGSGRRRA